MAVNENGTICGLPAWVGIARNDTVSYTNNILLATVNLSLATFGILSNLAIIVAVAKTPSLQKPNNILLCSLAFADCLTGLTVQPVFVAWRFILQRAQDSCSNQGLVLSVYNNFNVFSVGLSFVNVVIISFDRHRALSKPLVYRASVTNEGTMKIAILSNIAWLLCSVTLNFIVPPAAGYIGLMICGASFLGIPVVNHIRMLFAIRRHNRQHKMMVLRREKKGAINMFVVTVTLVATLIPGLLMEMLRMQYPPVHVIVLPWALTTASMTAVFNPAFSLSRNSDLRNAVKTIFKIK